MTKADVNYSLYLVTDSTPAILGGRDLCAVVSEALAGGVTVVQYRDKTRETAVLVETGRRLHEITRGYGVPLLINDRVDVALAVGCEGVHIGQDDMDLPTARKLLGPNAIIGVTASKVEEALLACEEGADYLGIGTVFATPTKTNTKHIIGTAGVQKILSAMHANGHGGVATVCIGGINSSNTSRVVFQSAAPGEKALNGVAVVSAVMAAADPAAEARRLRELVATLPPFQVKVAAAERAAAGRKVANPADVLFLVPSIVKTVHDTTPLSHNMTNLVVQNFAANVALAVGASPIMSNYGEEAADLSKLGGSLVINMGTVTPEGLENYAKALMAYNQAGGPVLFDPVGAGATTVRRSAVQTIMAGGYLDIIKGNEGEIKTIYSQTSAEEQGQQQQEQQRGVDSAATLDTAQRVQMVRTLARREKNVVVMTGFADVASDGERCFVVENGHEYLGMVTGTGCCLGTTIAAMAAAHPQDKLLASVAGLLLYEIASERAAARAGGPGTFVPLFLDELHRIRRETAAGELGWIQMARLSSA